MRPDPTETHLPIRYTADGLVPAIAQQHDTGEVLMMAWMNAATPWRETLATNRVCYFSRSRSIVCGAKARLPASTQHLKSSCGVDCDGDTLLLLVDQTGAACHTGQRSCFHRALRDGALVTIETPLADPAVLYA